jgi:hypothetical protein
MPFPSQSDMSLLRAESRRHAETEPALRIRTATPAHFGAVLIKVKPKVCYLFIAEKTFCGAFPWFKNRYSQSDSAFSRLNTFAWFYGPTLSPQALTASQNMFACYAFASFQA